jgi:hypothetical protein
LENENLNKLKKKLNISIPVQSFPPDSKKYSWHEQSGAGLLNSPIQEIQLLGVSIHSLHLNEHSKNLKKKIKKLFSQNNYKKILIKINIIFTYAFRNSIILKKTRVTLTIRR